MFHPTLHHHLLQMTHIPLLHHHHPLQTHQPTPTSTNHRFRQHPCHDHYCSLLISDEPNPQPPLIQTRRYPTHHRHVLICQTFALIPNQLPNFKQLPITPMPPLKQNLLPSKLLIMIQNGNLLWLTNTHLEWHLDTSTTSTQFKYH